MSMDIIEVFSKGKHSDATNEDGWIVTDDFAAVIDGSTSKVKVKFGKQSKGQLAMETTRKAIISLPSNSSMPEALQILTKALATVSFDNLQKEAAYRLTCSAVIFSRYRRELWYIGDCQSRYWGVTHTHTKLTDTILTQIRCDVIRHLLKHGYTLEDIRRNDLGRNFILDALREQCNFQNDNNIYNYFRYPVLDGTPIPPELVPVASVGNTNQLILASDGYPQLFNTLAETEEGLKMLLARDPLCIQENPATKCLIEGNDSFDDRTYLRITI